MADSTVTSREMTASSRENFDKVFAQLQDDGLLLMSELVYLITNERIRGSWWSHELAQTIFNVSEMLEDHHDVLIMKLISAKVTFVHRELWNHIYSIGVAREDWQVKKLSPKARRYLKIIDAAGSLQTAKGRNWPGPIPADVANELESRVLIHTEQIHTESGKHARLIETWDAWAIRASFRAHANDPVAARHVLEQRLALINEKHDGRGKLPWPSTLSNT